ncbi:MAG: hypothetical protein QNK24_01775, partial [Desulfuromusa sp.]|nr:hypothetical protein [Desulfuromusa sp.]
MRKIISIRWKILAGLLVLAIFPMLLLTYLFSDIASSQVREQMELMADQAGRYIMQGASQSEDALLESLELLGGDAELLNAIYFGQITEDREQLHSILKNTQAQFGFDRLELVLADGHRHTLDAETKTGEPVIIKKSAAKKVEFISSSDTHISTNKNHLSITALVPLNLEGSLIGNLRALRYIDDQYARTLQQMTGAEIAFHDGEKIVASSLAEFKDLQLDLDVILDDDAVLLKLNNRSHIVYN